MRPTHRILVIVTVAAFAAAALLSSALANRGAEAAPRVLTGSISQTNKSWICHGPVHLDSVSVTIDANFKGPNRGAGNNDAIHLSSGCTGEIGQIHVVQYQGDGVKVGEGSHDLTIGGGDIRCFARAPVKHQDGIQAMGGQRVHFNGLSVSCPTANDSSLFVNQGTASAEVPTDIVCDDCTLLGGTFTVRITHSVRSGIANSRIARGKFGAVRIDHTQAVDPVNVNNVVVDSGAINAGPPKLVNLAKSSPTPARAYKAVTVVSANVSVDKPVQLKVQALATSKNPLLLLAHSKVGTAVSGRVRTAIFFGVGTSRTVGITLRLPTRQVQVRRTYVLSIGATDAAGQSATLNIPFRR